eukprot:2646894-Pyramimonas_sp.AAC.1
MLSIRRGGPATAPEAPVLCRFWQVPRGGGGRGEAREEFRSSRKSGSIGALFRPSAALQGGG